MARQFIKQAGSVDQQIRVHAWIPSTGLSKTGLVFNTASLVCYYVREGAAAVQLSLVTQTVDGAHTDGGFVLVSDTLAPGEYRLDLSDAVIAAGVPSVSVILSGVADVEFEPVHIDLTAFDPVAAAATAAEIADAIADEPAAEHSTAGTIGKLITDTSTNAGTAASSAANADAGVTFLLGNDQVYPKNTAVPDFVFYMENTDGSPGIGKTVTVKLGLDGGAFAAPAGAISEISDGWYKVSFTDVEFDGDEVAFIATATGAKQTNIKIRTQS